MGYRSQVRSLVYGEPDIVQAFWTKHKLTNQMIEQYGDSIKRYSVVATGHNVDGQHSKRFAVIDLYGDGWKWYEDYPDVKAWYKFMDDAAESGLCYEFLRVGEELDDIEERNSGEDVMYWLYCNRTIDDAAMPPKEETNEQDAESQG